MENITFNVCNKFETIALLLVTRTAVGRSVLTEGFIFCILPVSYCKYLFANVCQILI